VHTKLDFNLATPQEILAQIASRLKAQRLSQGVTQLELAARAGVAKGTLQNLETHGSATLESFCRVACALGLSADLQPLFLLKVQSIAQMQAAEGANRQRAPRKPRPQ
jgi:transcriptional regulator with XRE-family HTH domain